jgi:hypothetical protein
LRRRGQGSDLLGANLDGRFVAVALDDPGLVVEPLGFQQRLA